MSRVAAMAGACLFTGVCGLLLLGNVAPPDRPPAVGEVMPGVAPPPSDPSTTEPTPATTEPEIVAVGQPPVPPTTTVATTMTTTTTVTTLVESLPAAELPETG